MNSVNLEGGMDGTARIQVAKFRREGRCHWGSLRGGGDFCGVLNGIWKEEGGDWLKPAEDKTCNLELIWPSPLPLPFSLLSLLTFCLETTINL